MFSVLLFERVRGDPFRMTGRKEMDETPMGAVGLTRSQPRGAECAIGRLTRLAVVYVPYSSIDLPVRVLFALQVF